MLCGGASRQRSDRPCCVAKALLDGAAPCDAQNIPQAAALGHGRADCSMADNSRCGTVGRLEQNTAQPMPDVCPDDKPCRLRARCCQSQEEGASRRCVEQLTYGASVGWTLIGSIQHRNSFDDEFRESSSDALVRMFGRPVPAGRVATPWLLYQQGL